MNYRVHNVSVDDTLADHPHLTEQLLGEIQNNIEDESSLVVVDEDGHWCDASEFFLMTDVIEFKVLLRGSDD